MASDNGNSSMIGTSIESCMFRGPLRSTLGTGDFHSNPVAIAVNQVSSSKDVVKTGVNSSLLGGGDEEDDELMQSIDLESLRHRLRHVNGGRPWRTVEMTDQAWPSSATFSCSSWSSSGVHARKRVFADGHRISLYRFAHWSSFRPGISNAGMISKLSAVAKSGSSVPISFQAGPRRS